MRSCAAVLTSVFLCAMVGLGADPAGAASSGTIAFISQQKKGMVRSLFLAGVASNGVSHRVSRPADAVEAFAWSPNGVLLAYSAAGIGGRSSVIVERANGTRPRVLSRSCATVCPLAWTPDGTSVALPGAAGKVLVVRVSDGHVRTVARIRGRMVTALAWSPDGTRLALRAPLAHSSPPEGPSSSSRSGPDGSRSSRPASRAGQPGRLMARRCCSSPTAPVDALAVGVASAPRVLASGSSPAFSPDGGRISLPTARASGS